jgi:hypothetical protein
MEKSELIKILHKNSQGLLPERSLDELLTKYTESLESKKEVETEVNEPRARDKFKVLTIEIKNIFIWKFKKIIAKAIIKVLNDDDIRFMVKQKVQTKQVRQIAEIYDGVIDTLRGEYWHELDTAVKKEFTMKWLSVCRQLLIDRLKN